MFPSRSLKENRRLLKSVFLFILGSSGDFFRSDLISFLLLSSSPNFDPILSINSKSVGPSQQWGDLLNWLMNSPSSLNINNLCT